LYEQIKKITPAARIATHVILQDGLVLNVMIGCQFFEAHSVVCGQGFIGDGLRPLFSTMA